MAFENIAGYKKEKQILENLQNIYRNVDDYQSKGLRIPRGILLYGEPGVGKTVMARTFASISNKIVELRAADCINEDTSSTNIINAFEDARQSGKAVLIIDEIDKIAEESSSFFMESNNSVMKVLLQELDKSEDNKDIVIIATANRIDNINPAIIRSGRFDRQIMIPNPNKEDRKAIANHYFSKLKLKNDVDMNYLIMATQSYAGADIECLINESGILAYEEGRDSITNQDIRTVMARMATKSIEQDINEDESKHVVAVHEAGHALVAFLTAKDRTTISASIIPQGDNNGRVLNFEHACNRTLSLPDLKNQIKVGLGGRCAEQLVLNTLYAGSRNDLMNAYVTAFEMVAFYGYAGVEYIALNPRRSPLPISNDRVQQVEKQANAILLDCENDVKMLLSEHREFLYGLIRLLEQKHLITYEDINGLYLSIEEQQFKF